MKHQNQNRTSNGNNQPLEAAGRLRRRVTERMWSIHQLISGGKYPNATDLARKFEVSKRIIRRDIEYMRDHFHMSIEFDAERNGFYYTKPGERFPGAPALSQEEIFALVVARKATAQYRGLPIEKALESAFEKLVGQLDKQERAAVQRFEQSFSFRTVGGEDTPVAELAAVAGAVKDNHVLRFSYRKTGARDRERRTLHPYHVAWIDNRWYAIGHDPLRRETRTFIIGRMAELEVTAESFAKPLDFDAEEYLRSAFGVMPGKENHEVVVEFDAWAADVMGGRQWHPTQKTEPREGGGSRLRFKVGRLEEVERWVLSWGTHATVLQPQELRQRIWETACVLVKRYGAAVEIRNSRRN